METYVREWAVEEGPLDDWPHYTAAIKLLAKAEPGLKFRQGDIRESGQPVIIHLADDGIHVWVDDADEADGGSYVTFNYILRSVESEWRFRSPTVDQPYNEMLIVIRRYDDGDPELSRMAVI